MYVFRNNTIERFFPKDYHFSGYDDISVVPQEEEGFVWFFQVPLSSDTSATVIEIEGYRQKFGFVMDQIAPSKMIIAITMDRVYDIRLTDDDYRIQLAVADYNSYLLKAAQSHSNLKVIDFSEFTCRYPHEDLIDWKFFFISQMGINPRLSKDFQAWWHSKLESVALKRKKCLVLDLDNTLWGGVLGEDGISGIKIGGDYPGKAFLFFQKSLLNLSQYGVILTVCSKNNEKDVLEAWEKNPYIVLKKENFSAYRINWQDKATNLKELASELNIGLDSFVFVDDNPTERELIKQMLPMVSVPDFPAQPYELPLFYKQLVTDYFKVYSVTDEDKKKTEQYKANAARLQAEHSFSDFSEFLKSLEMKLTIEAANEFNLPRIAQMTQKTNQFNLTTHRYTDSDVKCFLEQGWSIWCLSVADRFGDNGITGCIMINPDRMIDTFLLSCRILGKGIEFAFIKKVLTMLRDTGVVDIKANYFPTAKNSQVADFYEKCGFTMFAQDNDGAKHYAANLSKIDLTIDDFYHIVIK